MKQRRTTSCACVLPLTAIVLVCSSAISIADAVVVKQHSEQHSAHLGRQSPTLRDLLPSAVVHTDPSYTGLQGSGEHKTTGTAAKRRKKVRSDEGLPQLVQEERRNTKKRSGLKTLLDTIRAFAGKKMKQTSRQGNRQQLKMKDMHAVAQWVQQLGWVQSLRDMLGLAAPAAQKAAATPAAATPSSTANGNTAVLAAESSTKAEGGSALTRVPMSLLRNAASVGKAATKGSEVLQDMAVIAGTMNVLEIFARTIAFNPWFGITARKEEKALKEAEENGEKDGKALFR